VSLIISSADRVADVDDLKQFATEIVCFITFPNHPISYTKKFVTTRQNVGNAAFVISC